MPGAASSASSSSRPRPANSAMSPPRRICTNSSAIGDAVADDAVHLLRILEPHQAGLGQRVDGDDLRAVGLGLLQHREHARMVGAGVLPGDQDAVGVFDVVSTVTEPLPMPIDSTSAVPDDSWHMLEQSGRLLVPKLRTQQLVEERGLVAGAARRVEQRFVGGGQRVEVLGDQAVGVVPADRRVVACRPGRSTIGWVSRPCWASQYSGLSASSATECRAKNSGVTRALGRLLGDGLGAVLAELGELAAAGLLGPGAARAVETVPLIEPRQRRGRAHRTHLGRGRVAATPSPP